MARPHLFKNSKVISTRLEADFYETMQEIAALESINTGKKVTCQELIRDALTYVYSDNEKLRECFRRSRKRLTSRLRQKP